MQVLLGYSVRRLKFINFLLCQLPRGLLLPPAVRLWPLAARLFFPSLHLLTSHVLPRVYGSLIECNFFGNHCGWTPISWCNFSTRPILGFGVQCVWRQSWTEVNCHEGLLWQGRQHLTFIVSQSPPPFDFYNSFWHIFLGIRVAHVWFIKDCWVPQCEVGTWFVLVSSPIKWNPPTQWWPRRPRYFEGWHGAITEHHKFAWPRWAPRADPHLILWSSPPRNPNQNAWPHPFVPCPFCLGKLCLSHVMSLGKRVLMM